MRGTNMADADLDVIIRQLAKQQHKSLTAAVKARRDRILALAQKAKDGEARQRFRQLAKHALEEGTAAAKRLQMSADNAADSYGRAMRRAADSLASQPVAAPKKTPGKKAAKSNPKKAKARSA
jgi:hypothetical protein